MILEVKEYHRLKEYIIDLDNPFIQTSRFSPVATKMDLPDSRDPFHIPVEEWNEEEAKNKKYLIVTYDELIKLPLSYWMLNNNMCIKIRTLLQYIGTDIGKQLIDNNLWTKLIANTISTKATKYRLCIIPDVRFRDETEMIKKLGGIIIKINRNTENNDNDKHISECIDNIKEDYIIDNNGTKFNLFYNIFNIINTVYREKREIIESRNNN